MELPGFTAQVSLFNVKEREYLVTRYGQYAYGTIVPMMKKIMCLVCDEDGCMRIDCRNLD